MPDGTDWLYRPVSEQYIKYESLIDGTLDLEDVAELNDMISVKQENERRAQEYMSNR